MDKYDWLETITRGIGVWFFLQGLLAIVGAIIIASGAVGGDLAGPAFVSALASTFVGSSAIGLAPNLVGWLRNKDDAARAHGGRSGLERS